MKKIMVLGLFSLLVFLSGCTETEITCGEGTIEVNGICELDTGDNNPVDNEDPVDTENPIDNEDPLVSSCETDLSLYGGTDYEMVWNDEFDTDGMLDDTKWEYLIGNGHSEGHGSYGYTSGRVRTMNHGDWKYGIVEVCAMMPDTLGTWPAIWMLPTDSPYGGWPNGGEIDIMEAVGFESNTVHFNIHTKNDNWGTSRSIGSHSTINNIATEYHRYAVKWTETEITFYVDGVQRFVYTPQAYSYEYWPFDQDFHLILNVAVGGAWGGQRGVKAGDWEDSMYVDYVRVYQ